MRILFWAGNFWPRIGGTAIFADKVLPALHRRGHDLMVIAPQSSADQPKKDQFHGIPVYRFPFWQNRTFSDVEQLMNTIKQVGDLKKNFSPDIVHISGLDIGNFFHLETARVHSAPTLVTLHDSQMQDNQTNAVPTLETLMGRILKSADWVTCVSNDLLTYLHGLMPNLKHKSSLVYNGLAQPQLIPSALPTNPPNLLCCGRLVHRKGFDIALNIFASLLKRHPALQVTIAGDGPQLSTLKSRAQSMGIKDRITFLGWVGPDQVASVMNEATIVLMPSRREPFGLVALEAALMGRPIVATRVGGLQEIVVHQQTGLLVDNEDTQDFETATDFLLTNLDIASAMGKAARGRALEHFRLTQCVESYDRLYQELVTQWQLTSPKFEEVFTYP
jgi:glycogen(starch) synthase